ncbi:MAG TPA: hypothetical protein PLB89_16765 [Flavobacteriales bacterium]|nr:hypothetical protein [Flavobacteriales bacterium]
MPRILIFILVLTSGYFSHAQVSPKLREDHWFPNGVVECVARKGDTLLLGGAFSEMAKPLWYGTLLDPNDGSPVQLEKKPNGPIGVALPDNDGGCFLIGGFTRYADQDARRFLHLDADANLIPWVPDVPSDFYPSRMLRWNGWVFLSTPSSITAVHEVTGANIGWMVNTLGAIWTFAVHNDVLYMGGDFTLVGGQARAQLAALDITTGSVTPWQVNSDGLVRTMVADGDGLIVGGDFTTLSGSFRDGLAKLDYASGIPQAWTANTNGPPNSLVLENGTLHICGNFSSVAGQPRSFAASLNSSTAAVLPWAPTFSNAPWYMSLVNGELYIAGSFISVNGEPRDGVAIVDAATGELDPWTMGFDPDGNILVIVPNGDRIFVGGSYERSDVVERSNFAALDLVSGDLLPWSITIGGVGGTSLLLAFHLVGDSLFLGGRFTSVDGQSRTGLACIDLDTHQLLPWAPVIANSYFIHEINDHRGKLYVSGWITSINGLPRNNIASFELADLSLTAWDVEFGSSDFPKTMFFIDDLVYVPWGGSITFARIAAYHELTGIEVPWNSPSWNSSKIYDMQVRDGILYFVGNFTEVNDAARLNCAAVEFPSGELTSWDPGPFGISPTVVTLGSNSSGIYLGGNFTAINGIDGTYAGNLASVDAVTGACTSEEYEFQLQDVRQILVNDTMLIAGGDFMDAHDTPISGLVIYRLQEDITTTLPQAVAPRPNEELELWPNPLTNGPLRFTVHGMDLPANSEVAFVDAAGRWHPAQWEVVPSVGQHIGSSGVIATPQLSAGVYCLHIMSKNSILSAQVVILADE